MSVNLAVASQGFAEQIAKQAGALTQVKEPQNKFAAQRKPDLENIFQAHGVEPENKVKALTGVKTDDPIVVQETGSIFSTPVAQSQYQAAQVAHKADLQNYDASAVGAKFGGIA
ncbi:MAG: hypothetical protein A2Y25_05020 [Candidatus Melainabacteria bacterium GWF2_37_15]|nr:MAG: hypothetical protein A2Y25_05020 [Candidatus Melainabacteria bacterium GWF2_37_15]